MAEENAENLTEKSSGLRLLDSNSAYMGSQYTDDVRVNCAIVWLTYGNVSKTAEATGISRQTIGDWQKKDWWIDLVSKIRQEKKQEFDSGFSRIIEKSMKSIESQLDADTVSARDAATIMGITFDKRQVLNNRPTNISGKALDINKLQGEFSKFMEDRIVSIQDGEVEEQRKELGADDNATD